MQERVRQKIESGAEKKVYLRGDGAVSLQELTSITDRLTDAGVVDIAFDEARRNPGAPGKIARRRNRTWREIEPGRFRAVAGER